MVGLIDLAVKDGVVKLQGALTGERERQAIRIGAENIPEKVEDHLIWIEPNTGVAGARVSLAVARGRPAPIGACA